MQQLRAVQIEEVEESNALSLQPLQPSAEAEAQRAQVTALLTRVESVLSTLHRAAPRLRHRAAHNVEPLVMGILGGLPDAAGTERRDRLTELIRQAIGFQTTLDAGEERALSAIHRNPA